ncbi:hypothetical protein GGR53DRAFT_192911 [Hypoxylon sp. FL1150]|nr:hypothetical protein GGR53DRAFT_192911 [Hypoxylon sp. FL1150]
MLERTFLSGLIDMNGKIAPFGFTCQTSNCTWPDFTTLGLCSSCSDMSNITAIAGKLHSKYYFDLTVPGEFSLRFSDTNGDISPFWIVTSGERSESDNLLVSIIFGQFNSSDTLTYLSQVDEGHNITMELSARSLAATKCLVTWCARTYRGVSVINGVLGDYDKQENTLQRMIDETNVFHHEGQTYFIPGKERGGWNAPRPPFKDSKFLLPDDAEISRIVDLIGVQFAFFNMSYPFGYLLPYGKDVSAEMASVVDSMTNTIGRSTNSTLAHGTAWTEKTIILIRWAWLAPPLAVVLFSVVFLFTTLILNHKRGVPVWKFSLTPFFFHGIQDWSEEENKALMGGFLEQKRDVDAKAEALKVKINRNELGGTYISRCK